MTEQYLNQVRDKIISYNYLVEQIKKLDDKIKSVSSPSFEASYGGDGSDRLTEMIFKLDELKECYITQEIEISSAKKSVENAISSLGGKEQSVIRHYYLEGLEWKEVADKMLYSISSIFNFRNSALKQLEEMP